MERECTNTSSPSSQVIKPKPFLTLNHFTTPRSRPSSTSLSTTVQLERKRRRRNRVNSTATSTPTNTSTASVSTKACIPSAINRLSAVSTTPSASCKPVTSTGNNIIASTTATALHTSASSVFRKINLPMRYPVSLVIITTETYPKAHRAL